MLQLTINPGLTLIGFRTTRPCFSTWRARSMHDVACEFARAVVRSKDAQKQLAGTSLRSNGNNAD